ncbi:MAG TPA: type II CAAX endopeptidase family protein [Blastocatellia bacterium]|nr:type II CAAX endopeptidase family protein [Blastocatellia bacterium]
MVDQLSSVETCGACGSPLGENRESTDRLCDECRAHQPVALSTDELRQADADAVQPLTPYADYYATLQPQPEAAPDPDRPHWGPITGIGVWLFSVAAIIVVPFVAVFAWYLLDRQRGVDIPVLTDAAAMLEYVQSARLIVVQIYSTIIAHLVTLGFCWVVVTRLKRYPFLKSLGWNWAGKSAGYWVLFSAAVFIAIMVADFILTRFVPQSEPPFTELLKKSYHVKVAVAVLATFSAPFVEEVIYRGVLYSGLRKFFGVPATIIAVTVLFAGVHVPQYWGAWASLSGLMLLSLTLTVVRARTKSILPCVVIHTVNNSVISLLLVLGIVT